jgi:methylenetetrahydrofolate dehydrogenase (NADP+)/methenyltetrahydrofolate cyclohydrolase
MASASIIDGKALAAELSGQITLRSADLLEKTGIKPGLAVVIVGEDPASQVYVRNKKRTAEACGFHSVQHTLPEDASQNDVLQLIEELNSDSAIHGHLEGAFVPCTPAGCMVMIEGQLGKDLSGLNAVIIGRSNIVGKPMASLLLKSNATVTVCHSRTKDLPEVARNADILVAAVGRPKMVMGDWIKPGAVVIDVGINRIQVEVDGETKNKLVGDVDFDEASRMAGAITPVPGGVGPMTIVMLMSNTLQSAERAASR